MSAPSLHRESTDSLINYKWPGLIMDGTLIKHICIDVDDTELYSKLKSLFMLA